MPRNHLSPLTAAQREIMELVWDHGEVSVSEVRGLLSETRAVARNTVQTLMTRMHEKGWLTYRKIGRTFLYSAAVPKRVTLGHKVRELVDTTFGGSAEELMSALLEYRGLTKKEADRIRDMIDQAEQSTPGRRRKPSK